MGLEFWDGKERSTASFSKLDSFFFFCSCLESGLRFMGIWERKQGPNINLEEVVPSIKSLLVGTPGKLKS